MAYEPTTVAQQAIDAAGLDYTLGDLEDGTRPAQVTLRAYERCLRQLLRGVHWDFARKTAPLVLLADATGQSANAGTLVPVPWVYSYGYPIDCVKARYIPWNRTVAPASPLGNIVPADPTAPLMTGLTQPPLTGQRVVPARFVIATDANNLPPNPGYETPGLSPAGQTVVLTNVQSAQMVYTCMQVYPSMWDELFRGAFVAYLASEIAVPLAKDKKMGMAMRDSQIPIVKDKIKAARIADGNEGWFSSDLRVSWMDARYAGSGNYANGMGNNLGPGVLGYGYDSCSFCDGSAY